VATIDIDFEWNVGRSYELADRNSEIRQTSRSRDRKRPLQIEGLYLKFAGLDGSPKACLEFAKSWGLLRQPAGLGASERVSDWKREIARMRSVVDVSKYVMMGGVRALVTKVDVELVSGDLVGNVILRFRPPTLVDAMMVQFAQSQANGGSLHECQQCGRWFEVGASGKRSVSKFCSIPCRNKFNYERRVKPAKGNPSDRQPPSMKPMRSPRM
jgi:hypothetical protein